MKRIVSIALVLVWVGVGYANEEITVELPGGATMEFVWIEPGTFLMGAPDSEEVAQSHEKPQHEVTITQGFYLGQYEITQGQWEAVMGSNPSYFLGANRPVEYVSWYDVHSFIHALNEAAGDSLYRLPTEAEWEYTCRVGTTTRWSFGDEESLLEEYAWYSGNRGFSKTRDVGTKLPNPWGLYDMHGNVWEWCQDRYGGYTSDSQVDPTGPATGLYRVIRGGFYKADASYVRSASRSGHEPGYRYFALGARLLRMVPQSTILIPESWGQIKNDSR